MKCASALSTAPKTADAFHEATQRLASGLEDGPADLALVFGSAHHAEDLGGVTRDAQQRGFARHLIACTGESIVGEGREVEESPALSLLAIRFALSVSVHPLRLEGPNDGIKEIAARLPGTSTAGRIVILLGDPFSFPAEKWFQQLEAAVPGLRVVGGMASGGHSPGKNRLIVDDRAYQDGAVALLIDGPTPIRTVVSQGCRPVGRPLLVTKSEGNLIRELGRRPSLEVLQEVFQELDPEEQEMVRDGLHIGRVINEYQETFERGDFLVRNVLGADDSGAIAVTDHIRVGQTVQFHVRDARTADEDLSLLLAEARASGSTPRGALLFTCNGRGSRLFDQPDHDVSALQQAFGPLPTAGFFAMGEFGPVGGHNFIHGFTASVALFEEPPSSA